MRGMEDSASFPHKSLTNVISDRSVWVQLIFLQSYSGAHSTNLSFQSCECVMSFPRPDVSAFESLITRHQASICFSNEDHRKVHRLTPNYKNQCLTIVFLYSDHVFNEENLKDLPLNCRSKLLCMKLIRLNHTECCESSQNTNDLQSGLFCCYSDINFHIILCGLL